jgi:hypothetical protein
MPIAGRHGGMLFDQQFMMFLLSIALPSIPFPNSNFHTFPYPYVLFRVVVGDFSRPPPAIKACFGLALH